MMHSISGWKLARRPNYNTNNDREYPYSEVPYLGEYHLVKLPISLNNLIDHVDYWGEGKIVTKQGNSGFSDCYNVNHPYQLVSNGPDRGRKIPNRIPVYSYFNCDTSSYIKDNSVLNVTVMGAPINTSCAQDIARMVSNDFGKVIVYGFENNSIEIQNLTTELEKKKLFHWPSYIIPDEFQGMTLFDTQMAFLNLTSLKDELHKNVTNGLYDNALDLSKILNNERRSEDISDIVTKLLRDSTMNIMTYAYKLWHNVSKEIVQKNFPLAFSLIFNEDPVVFVNKQHNLPLKVDANTDNKDTLVLGGNDNNKNKLSWKIIQVWDNNSLKFKLFNEDSNMYLKLDENVDRMGDRKAWASIESDEAGHMFYLEPVMDDEKLAFRIINYLYSQGLKLDSNENKGSRQLWGFNGDPHNNLNNFKWIIAAS